MQTVLPIPCSLILLYHFAEVCGSKLTGSNGTVTSPNYPGHYPPDVTCVWVIQVKSSKVVELEFKFLDVEHSKKCKYDSLEILDGATVGLLYQAKQK